jgi:hypothetical protein
MTAPTETGPTTPSAAERVRLHAALGAVAEAGPHALRDALLALAAPDCRWRVACPIDELDGTAAAAAAAFGPLKEACPDLERRDLILLAGSYEGRTFLGAMGHYVGTLERDWLGLPATRKTLWLRYGEVYRIGADGRAVEAWLLWDVLDAMRQAGVWPLAPALGAEACWPPPFTGDGLRLAPAEPAQSAASLAQTLAMQRTLAEHDDRRGLSREMLLAMPQREHWHPKMMWYGPAGIGTTRGLAGFVDGHQLPFRIAFHRPQGSYAEVQAERARHGAGHYVRIGDGPYSLTGGWPSVYALHRGGGFLGLPPTDRPIRMRVMDFYLHHEGRIRENWVPIDLLDVLRQMGLDPLARLREILRR